MEALAALLAECGERADVDAATRASLRELAATADPFARTSSLHITGSALVVHRPSRHLLLRYHEQVGGWIQLGGHGEAGERDPFVTALRESAEECGLNDLSWTGEPAIPPPAQVIVVPVGRRGEAGAHRHVDFRYLLFTERPERTVPEHAGAPLRWVGVEEAAAVSSEANLQPLFALAERCC